MSTVVDISVVRVKGFFNVFVTIVPIFSGSPFQFTVGPITDGGSHKVRAIGPGLERGETNKPCEFLTVKLK